MKKLILVLALIISTSVHTQINKANESVMVSLDQDIAESVLRFHVLANSDTQEDQDLKMKVKNVVADQVAKDMRAAGIESKKDAVQYITTNEDEYIDIAEEVIKENGYDYPVSTTLGKTWFPVKVYGNYIFPEGEYDAFRILIGNAEGKNWWCVLFPSLCMVEEAYLVADDSTYEEEETNVTFQFRIVEWFEDMW